MAIFADKDTKALFLRLSAVLFLLLAAGQLITAARAANYKQTMLSHDYAIAGYLARENVDPILIQKAFTGEKSGTELRDGKKLLKPAGYSSEAGEKLFTDLRKEHGTSALSIFLLSLSAALGILACVFCYVLRREKKYKKAIQDIGAFMNGNTDVRLGQQEEGSLSGLFNSINGLVTSLNSHIIIEKQNKEFLKDTISNISHQLKTPLAALRMYNEILQSEQTENEVIRDFLCKTDRELNRMEILIQNLLKLARLDSGTIVMDKRKNSVRLFLEELLEDFRMRANNEDKEMLVSCDEHMTLSFDEEWMHEAVSNIVKNAFDHTPAGGRIELIGRESAVVSEIIIKDNGAGIHPEDIHSIFKRFYRSRHSKDKQGIGIGLTLSKMIVEQHGGSITAESKPDNGTEFRLAFSKLTNT